MNEHANLKKEIHQMEANKEVSISFYNKIVLILFSKQYFYDFRNPTSNLK